MFSVFKNINRFAGKNKLLDSFAIFCAKYLAYLISAYLFLFAILSHHLSIFLSPFFSGCLGAFVIDTIIYIFYKEKRPAELKNTNLLIAVPKNPSFPSRHTSFVFGLSFCLFFFDIQLATVFIVCSCLTGISRVFCGVHWFRDILAGVLVGLVSALIIYGLVILIS